VTFSVVASDGSAWGVAVASKFLAVGAAVPAGRAGVGAIATQSWANLAYRPEGLALLGEGRSAQQVVDALVTADDGRERRQLGIVDAAGRAATYTGGRCQSWAGGIAGDGYAIQGNILTGPEVIEAMQAAWLGSDPGRPLPWRLLAALEAGDAAGGDRRGRQSAALLALAPGAGYLGGSDQLMDLRVDDHETPIPELARLMDCHEELFGPVDPDTALPLTGMLADEVFDRLTALGHPPTGSEPAALDAALAAWAGVENFEERLVPGRIDPRVLDALRTSPDSG